MNVLKNGFHIASRLQRITFVLYRYGIFGTLTDQGFEIGKRGITFVGLGKRKSIPLDRTFGKSLKETLIQLGPTFIKLGQVLATRPDLIGTDVAEELKPLFDRVPSLSFAKINRILKKEWGKKKYKENIREIQKKSLGSASLSQTHEATLNNGAKVIIKIQKPGAGQTVKTDLMILEGLVNSIHPFFPLLMLKEAFKDFKEATLREIDYLEEAKNIDQFLKNYKKVFSQSDVLFPSYVKELSTNRVIVLSPMQGKKMTEISKDSNQAKRAAIAGLTAVLEQIFEHGFFHGDPHAGNIFYIEETGKVGFIDMGLVGTLSEPDRKKFLKVLFSLLKRDRRGLSKALFDMGETTSLSDFEGFDKAVAEIIEKVKKTGVSQVRMDEVLQDLLKAARTYGIYVPNRFTILLRSCLVIEGVAKSLDPSISIVKLALPIVVRGLLKPKNPFRLFKK